MQEREAKCACGASFRGPPREVAIWTAKHAFVHGAQAERENPQELLETQDLLLTAANALSLITISEEPDELTCDAIGIE